MKKIIATILNICMVVLCLGSLAILQFGSSQGNAISYLTQPDYEDSPQFEALASGSITDIFDYVELTSIFEKDGRLNLSTIIAQADQDGSSVSYSLDYLIQYARSMGFYLNDKNNLVSNGVGTVTKEDDELNHKIRVTYRAYMPDYKPASPTDGQMSLGTLAKEALGYLSRYYAVKSEFRSGEGNFYFNVTYLDNTSGESTIYSNYPAFDSDAMRAMGKYVYADSDSLEVSTNLRSLPQDLVTLLQARNPYGRNSQYHFSVGIDCSFKNKDQFQVEASDYDNRRRDSIVGLTLLVVSSVGIVITLCLMVLFSGHSGKKDDTKIHLLYMDRFPPELLVALFLLLSWVYDSVTPVFLDSLSMVIGSFDEWYDTISTYASFLLKYLTFLVMFFSIVRNYKADELWQVSLIKRIGDLIGHYFQIAEQTASRFVTTVLFVIPNAAACLMVIAMFVHFYRAKSLYAFLFAIVTLIIVISIDFYTWRISTGLTKAVNEQVKSERLKADLITNVSHDLKTPLTSIISYVDLMKRENIENPRVQEYLEVLDQKSTRLKTLTEDLVEASKASSGNVSIDFQDIDYREIVEQALGEFEDKTEAAHLTMVPSFPDHPVMIRADGRHLWRVIENLLNNCCKYALRDSRVYVDIVEDPEKKTATCTIKNISSRPLNISPEELTERFVRGDVSRTTEGSGLGLSIAKSLTKLMDGDFIISIDGDLYKASVVLKAAVKEANDKS